MRTGAVLIAETVTAPRAAELNQAGRAIIRNAVTGGPPSVRTADLIQQHAATYDREWIDREHATKLCASCGPRRGLLPLEAFAPSKQNVGIHGKGRASYCRKCEAARQRARRAARLQTQ
jgi:hypothetical protein